MRNIETDEVLWKILRQNRFRISMSLAELVGNALGENATNE
jgi:hypothetical protein